MNLIEIAIPTGALDEADRATLAQSLTDSLVGERIAAAGPDDTMRRARSMVHVGFRELQSWHTGHGAWQPEATPPIWITLTVPEAWREEIAPTMIGLVRRGVRALDDAHGWQRDRGDLWINVVGIEEHAIGLDGRASTGDDVVAAMTAEYRSEVDPRRASLPEGVVLDPMCGMEVTLGRGAITLERDGQTLGFCASACRAAYARREGLEITA